MVWPTTDQTLYPEEFRFSLGVENEQADARRDG